MVNVALRTIFCWGSGPMRQQARVVVRNPISLTVFFKSLVRSSPEPLGSSFLVRAFETAAMATFASRVSLRLPLALNSCSEMAP